MNIKLKNEAKKEVSLMSPNLTFVENFGEHQEVNTEPGTLLSVILIIY